MPSDRAPSPPELEPGDPVVALYMRDVDRSLLRENLRKSPQERVEALIALQALAEEARRAGRRLRAER